ncbi:MAG: DNA polymerase ligase N-terminal domain-containing protein [Thermoproteota archaeon]|nr:3'-phosphoesterase [Candidatus Brockarchaeota archaeon]
MIYVIQKHEATHLHYDLRLEMDGVLKSWAIPKEPENRPGIRRLAIQVEDHPLEYADFEGIIPEGQYGAGRVEKWDFGYYELIKKTENSIEIEIHGRRLVGRFILIRFGKAGGNTWLFFKKRNDRQRLDKSI